MGVGTISRESGGLISVWDDDILKRENVLKSQRMLAIKFSNRKRSLQLGKCKCVWP